MTTPAQIAAASAFNRAMFALSVAERDVFDSACERGFAAAAPVPVVEAATAKINAAIAALQGVSP